MALAAVPLTKIHHVLKNVLQNSDDSFGTSSIVVTSTFLCGKATS